MADTLAKSGNGGLNKALIFVILVIVVCGIVGVLIISNKPKPTINPQSNKPTVSITPKAQTAYGNLSGQWTGKWSNSLGEQGDETLEITDDGVGNFQGTWSGTIKITGKWLNKTSVEFSGQTSTRAYQAQGNLQGSTLIINYTATRLNTSGTYTGQESLTRVSP